MRRKLQDNTDTKVELVSDFGKQKLILYANSFRNLAKTYHDTEKEYKGNETRQEYIYKRNLQENRGVLAENINDLADILCDVADENIVVKELTGRQKKNLFHFLKSQKVYMDKFCYTENENGGTQISVELAYIGRGSYSSLKVAKIFSGILNKEFIPQESSPLYLMEEFTHFTFILKPNFSIETGVARAVKETEKISGDSYGFSEDEKGRFCILLSDGMGSGDKAMADSELVIELTERFLEAGYPLEKTMKLINGVLASGVENKNMSTLDICDIDLYTGNCAFAKVGATVSFIKRDNMVDKMVAGNLPLGVFVDMEPEIMKRKLQEEDYVIMLSDGVLEGLGQVIGEEGLYDFLCAMDSLSAKEMANHLLNYVIRVCNGKIRDDMTILVAKVCSAS